MVPQCGHMDRPLTTDSRLGRRLTSTVTNDPNSSPATTKATCRITVISVTVRSPGDTIGTPRAGSRSPPLPLVRLELRPRHHAPRGLHGVDEMRGREVLQPAVVDVVLRVAAGRAAAAERPHDPPVDLGDGAGHVEVSQRRSGFVVLDPERVLDRQDGGLDDRVLELAPTLPVQVAAA